MMHRNILSFRRVCYNAVKRKCNQVQKKWTAETCYCLGHNYSTTSLQVQDQVHDLRSNTFTYRTHTCNELKEKDVGQEVTLCGWVEFVRISKFILLRDGYGTTQCVVSNEHVDVSNITLECVVKIVGNVTLRPKDMVNPKLSTGKIEVQIKKLEILNTPSELAFNLRSYQKPKEQLRLQHRYLDLRFPEMQYNLRKRSQILHNMRRFLVEDHNFVEVETPTLFCRTPGGSREFVVPTHHEGLFYSLVQSPQQFKQMLMSGAIDRYFQVARCYRDETTRPDRQPEFTQLDIELSFTNREGVIDLIERLLCYVFPDEFPKTSFTRMTYKEAVEAYGSDKPNLKYDLKLNKITHLFDEKDLNFTAYALNYTCELGKLTAKTREQIREISKKYKTKIILNEQLDKEFSTDIKSRITQNESHSIIAMGKKNNSCLCLGEVREILAKLLMSKNLLQLDEENKPLWVIDFPLFLEGEKGMETCHHPFTAPHPEDLHLLESEPLKVRSLAYDIVLNGAEIGGGSIRVHHAVLQKKLLTMLNINPDSLGHFLAALKSGCPPHGGIALGVDRLMMFACNADSIRDVIAFPKTHEGKDPLSGAPTQITRDDKMYYHLV